MSFSLASGVLQMQECLNSYNMAVQDWVAQAHLVLGDEQQSITRSLQNIHAEFQGKMVSALSLHESHSVEADRTSLESKSTIVQQAGIIQQLHELLEHAEETLAVLKRRFEECGREGWTGHRPDSALSSSLVAPLLVEVERASLDPTTLEAVQVLCAAHPRNPHLATLLRVFCDMERERTDVTAELQAARQERLEAECAWEMKLEGLMKRMDMLEGLAGRTSLPQYRRSRLT